MKLLDRTKDWAELWIETALAIHIIHAWQGTDNNREDTINDEVMAAAAVHYVRRVKEYAQNGAFEWPTAPAAAKPKWECNECMQPGAGHKLTCPTFERRRHDQQSVG